MAEPQLEAAAVVARAMINALVAGMFHACAAATGRGGVLGCVFVRPSIDAAPLQRALYQRLLAFRTCPRGAQLACWSDARPPRRWTTMRHLDPAEMSFKTAVRLQ